MTPGYKLQSLRDYPSKRESNLPDSMVVLRSNAEFCDVAREYRMLLLAGAAEKIG